MRGVDCSCTREGPNSSPAVWSSARRGRHVGGKCKASQLDVRRNKRCPSSTVPSPPRPVVLLHLTSCFHRTTDLSPTDRIATDLAELRRPPPMTEYINSPGREGKFGHTFGLRIFWGVVVQICGPLASHAPSPSPSQRWPIISTHST